MSVRSDVEPGQRFKYSGVAWEVVELCSLSGIPHVRIVRIGDPTELKLISVIALLERYDFAPESGAALCRLYRKEGFCVPLEMSA